LENCRTKIPRNFRVYEREKVTNHDLASFVDILQSKVGEDSNWIHYGLTSSDVVDTANSLLIRQSLDVCIELLDELLHQIELKAKQEMNTPIIGRTHGVFAETLCGEIKRSCWKPYCSR